MKLNERMRYPHPVLSEFSSDYVSGEFQCSFIQNMTPENEIKISANLQVKCDVLAKLISSQSAASGYFLICRPSYYNVLQEAALGETEKYFDAAKLYGAVVIRPVIWNLEEVENLSSPLFDKEFGDSVTVPKGSIFALGPEFRFSIDKQKFKPFESIFELAKDESVSAGKVEVDPDQDRIRILAESGTYKSIADMRNVSQGRDILLNAVYMPAIMDVLARLQIDDRSLEAKRWYRIFKAKCDDLGVNPADPGQSPLHVAQLLLRAPLTKAFSVAKTL